jgi:hypothetical protein
MRGSAKVLEGEAVICEEMLVSREGRDGSCELEDVSGEIKGERTVVCTEGN